MNEWMIVGIFAVGVVVAVKLAKGLIKMILFLLMLGGLLISANYLILPKMGRPPLKIGLEKFVQDLKIKKWIK